MLKKRLYFFGLALLAFVAVYYILEIGFQLIFNEPLEHWKSLTVAGISAFMLFAESFGHNPEFTFSQLWSFQKQSIQTSNSNAEQIEGLKHHLTSMGYHRIKLHGTEKIRFQTKFKFREPTLFFSIHFQKKEIILRAWPAFVLQLINQGVSHMHLERIKKKLEKTLHP